MPGQPVQTLQQCQEDLDIQDYLLEDGSHFEYNQMFE